MVRRNLRSDFVGGAYVFPGGAVDPLDGGAEAEAVCAGRTDAGGQRPAGLRRRAAWPTGWPSCARRSRRPACCWPARPEGPTSWPATRRRRPVSRPSGPRSTPGTRRFLDLCRDEGLRLTVGDIHYFAHWITPRGAPRRYDTRFFVAAAPPGQKAAHDAGETIADTWISPHDALGPPPRRRDRDHLPDHPQPPGHRPLRHQRGAARGGRGGLERGPGHRARVVPDGNGVRIVLPGDPGYERGGGGRPGDRRRWATSTRPCARSPCGPTRRVPTRRPDPDPPGLTGLRARSRRCRTSVSARAPEPGRVDEVAPGVLRLTAPNPGLMTGPGTNTYLVGRDELVVVDPGPADERTPRPSWRPPRPLGAIRTILVTHTHVDHAPGAAALAAATGARVVGFGPAEGFAPDECVRRGLDAVAAPAPGRRGPDAAGGAHAGPCLGPPVLARRGARAPAAPATTSCTARRWSSARPTATCTSTWPAWPACVTPTRPSATLAPGHGRLMDHVPTVVDALVAHRLGRHETVAAALSAAWRRRRSTSCCPRSTAT